jgi:hypothetical protein
MTAKSEPNWALIAKGAEPNWNAIATFYAGRPVKVNFGTPKGGKDEWELPGMGFKGQSLGTVFQGNVWLNPKLRAQFDDWQKNAKDPRRGPVAGAQALATLLHESVHLRDNEATGAKPWYDEKQAGALGSELMPDLLQRFFGIKINSKLNKKYMKAAKSLASYQSSYPSP